MSDSAAPDPCAAPCPRCAGARRARPGRTAPAARAPGRGWRRGRRCGSAPANGPPAGDHLVEHHAERPDVGPGVHLLAARLLGRHVADGAQHDAGLGLQSSESAVDAPIASAAAVTQLREAEVQDLDEAVGPEHDVLGLEVAVHDAGGVRGAQRRRRSGPRSRAPRAMSRGAPRGAAAASRPRRIPSR